MMTYQMRALDTSVGIGTRLQIGKWRNQSSITGEDNIQAGLTKMIGGGELTRLLYGIKWVRYEGH
jgi:hypothetical protein